MLSNLQACASNVSLTSSSAHPVGQLHAANLSASSDSCLQSAQVRRFTVAVPINSNDSNGPSISSASSNYCVVLKYLDGDDDMLFSRVAFDMAFNEAEAQMEYELVFDRFNLSRVVAHAGNYALYLERSTPISDVEMVTSVVLLGSVSFYTDDHFTLTAMDFVTLDIFIKFVKKCLLSVEYEKRFLNWVFAAQLVTTGAPCTQ